jgi:16S rRNA (guanine527-N7)-methyltransferase
MTMADEQLRRILQRFGVQPRAETVEAVVAYTELLVQWNRRVNLTGIRERAEIWRRHFGESFYLTGLVDFDAGRLVDVGSGAGFPGLALKLLCPALRVTLLEPMTKKTAFLGEVARRLSLESVEIVRQRWDEWRRGKGMGAVDFVTLRGVGGQEEIAVDAAQLLAPGGRLILLVSRADADRVSRSCPVFSWRTEKIPGARESVVLIGRR